MKKLLFIFPLLFSFNYSHAAFIESYQQGQASFTLTNDSQVQISTHGGILDGVLIGSGSAGGVLTIADAWVSTKSPNVVTYSTIAIISLSAGNTVGNPPIYLHFGVNMSSGITYTTTGNAGGVTIIWKPLINPGSGR